MLTYGLAREELFAQVVSQQSAMNAIAGAPVGIVVQGVEAVSKVPTDGFWLRLSQKTVNEEQATISGSDLRRRYTSEGLGFVQIFIPKTRAADYAKGVQLAELIKSAYRGKSTDNCMWFRNTRIQELPPEDAWFRLNVVTEYQYDEIG